MTGKITKLIFNLLKAVFAFLFVLIILYFLAALILSFMKTHPPKQDCLADKKIYITTNGVHLFSPAKTNQSVPVRRRLHPAPSRPDSGAVFQSLFCHLRNTREPDASVVQFFASSKKYSGSNFSCGIFCFSNF